MCSKVPCRQTALNADYKQVGLLPGQMPTTLWGDSLVSARHECLYEGFPHIKKEIPAFLEVIIVWCVCVCMHTRANPACMWCQRTNSGVSLLPSTLFETGCCFQLHSQAGRPRNFLRFCRICLPSLHGSAWRHLALCGF